MKKIVTMILVLAMVLSLCACGDNGGSETAGGEKTPKGLQVGYAREKIMPQSPVPLAGYTDSTKRMSTGFLDYLYATCIAVTEGEQTVLLFTQDLFKSEESWVDEVREKITAQTGIPGDHILICSTHNHSGPDVASSHSSIPDYRKVYTEALVKAASAALEDRAAATLYGTKTQTQNLNFPRHYLLSDNSYGGDNFGDFTGNSITGYANPAAPEMLLVKFDREGDKQDILMMNWQVYACMIGTSDNTNLTADFVAPVRQTLEEQTGMLFAYFNGAAGDLKPQSRITSDNLYDTGEAYGQAIAQCAIDALPNLTRIEGEGIKTSQVELEYAVNHEDEGMLDQAKEVVQVWNSTGITAGKNLAEQYGFRSVYHAQQVTYRITRPQTDVMEMNAVYVAGMAFVTAPFEMFSQSGIYIKENSPFDMTMVFSCANEYRGNFATSQAYDYHSYESDINYYAKGCAEAAQEKFVQMLKGLQ